jgi:hypothetical protein
MGYDVLVLLSCVVAGNATQYVANNTQKQLVHL